MHTHQKTNHFYTGGTCGAAVKTLTLTAIFLSPGIETFNSDSLKKAETKEKSVLPAPEDIQTEKTIQGILHGVESFESETLKAVKTREPLSPTAMIQVWRVWVKTCEPLSFTAMIQVWRVWVKTCEPLSPTAMIRG